MALEFTIFTAARTGEVLGATWGEIDFDAGVWIVPAARMKAGRPHRVPLSDRALAILRQLYELRFSDFIFPGQKRGRSLSESAMLSVLHRLQSFRSAFRQWCAEQTNFPREIAEAALAHINPDEVEAAYQRSDLLERRRKLMDAWANYCSRAPVAGTVVPLRR